MLLFKKAANCIFENIDSKIFRECAPKPRKFSLNDNNFRQLPPGLLIGISLHSAFGGEVVKFVGLMLLVPVI